MITKILPPTAQKGQVSYDNKGSSARLVNYFEHEGREQNQETFYFSQEQDGISKEEVVEAIDTNVKGLKKDGAKFISLIISPSKDELEHINNDPQKLKEYTRTVMENYAKNFTLKGGKQLEGKDLVWHGIVHETRKYTWDDKEVREGKAQRGDEKPGTQAHVHVIVSARDRAQKITLIVTDKTSQDRFSIKEFQRKNAESFQHQFGYSKQSHFSKEQTNSKEDRKRIDQIRYYEKRIDTLGDKLNLDNKVIYKIGEQASRTGYSKEFYEALKTYSAKVEKGEDKGNLSDFAGLKQKSEPNQAFGQDTTRQRGQGPDVIQILKGGVSTAGKDEDREILQDYHRKRKRGNDLSRFNF